MKSLINESSKKSRLATKRIIDNYFMGECKESTEDTIDNVAYTLIDDAFMSVNDVIDILGDIIEAIKDEYGD